MHRLAGFAATLVIIAAAGAGLYLASHYSDDRSVSNWTTPAASSDANEDVSIRPARATSSSQQRLMAEPGSCESQTWPNISPECITGQAEPAKVAARPALVPQQPSGILLRPTKLPEAVPETEVTGSLAASERLTVHQLERPVGAKAKNPRERPVTAQTTKPKPETRARAERKPLREAGRRNRSSPMIAVADRAAPESAERVNEPIQFRLAEGGNR
jgi:hypothetical protein